jgi:DNA-binding transcriptional MerR regulator
MLSIDEAAILARVNSRTIFHWAETGVVHSTETPAGLLLICPNSLNV